jgi:hypothetical protein
MHTLNQPRLFRTILRKKIQQSFGEIWELVEDSINWGFRILFHLIGNYFILNPLIRKYLNVLPKYGSSRILRFVYDCLICGYAWKIIHPIFDLIIPPPIEPENKGIFVNFLTAML